MYNYKFFSSINSSRELPWKRGLHHIVQDSPSTEIQESIFFSRIVFTLHTYIHPAQMHRYIQHTYIHAPCTQTYIQHTDIHTPSTHTYFFQPYTMRFSSEETDLK